MTIDFGALKGVCPCVASWFKSLHRSTLSTVSTLDVQLLHFRAAGQRDVATGLLGWATVIVGDTFVIDGIAVRRSAAGRPILAFPARTDASGKRHFVVRPVDDHGRHVVEQVVFAGLGIE